MLNVVIFGAPGSGKGTQSKLMMTRYGLDHVSTGEVIRAEIDAQSEIGKLADSIISKGQLLPDDITIEMLEDVLDAKKESKGIIFDGFPRTIAQAEALKLMLNKRGTDIAVMLDLEVADEVLTERLLERGKISGRSDDNPETIRLRLDVYRKHTAPLINYYRKEGKLVEINGTGSVEEIFSRIEKAIASIMCEQV